MNTETVAGTIMRDFPPAPAPERLKWKHFTFTPSSTCNVHPLEGMVLINRIDGPPSMPVWHPAHFDTFTAEQAVDLMRSPWDHGLAMHGLQPLAIKIDNTIYEWIPRA